MTEYEVFLRMPHERQAEIVNSKAKRLIVRAGRRSGKTVGVAIRAVKRFLAGKHVLYGAPSVEQIDRFWFEVCRALAPLIDGGVFKKDETEHTIKRVGTENRIKAKTVRDANTLRGDYSDDLYLDELQLMAEDTWEVVGMPMLMDNDGDAVFIYTPPSLRSSGISRASDPRYASKMFQRALEDTTGRWQALHFTSRENPYISVEALQEIIGDMTRDAYRQEILAEDADIPLSHLVYGAFSEETCKIHRMPINETWPRYVGHDFGTANPAALFLAQDPGTGYFYAYDEYLPGGGRSTAQHVEEFKRLTSGLNVIKRVGGSHQEEEIREAYRAHGWPIQEPRLQKVAPQIDKVIGLMQLNKLFVFEDLYHYLEEMMTCMWKVGNDGQPTNEIEKEARYHLCAAARYIVSDFVPETVASWGRDKYPAAVRSLGAC